MSARKTKATVGSGMRSFDHRLPATVTEADLLTLVGRLNRDPVVHGILVQLPLPPHIESQKILAAIDPAKDVDGFHPVNLGRLAAGLPALAPCTPLGCIILAKTVLPSLEGLDAVIIGRSNIVGKPLAQLLLAENATVTMAHSKTDGPSRRVPAAPISCSPRSAVPNGAQELDQAGRDCDRRRASRGWRCRAKAASRSWSATSPLPRFPRSRARSRRFRAASVR